MSHEAIACILQQEAEAVLNIPVTSGYEEAVTLIVKYVHELGGKLITSGMGKAGQIAMNIATTFSSTGTPAFFLHPSEAQHGDLGIVRDNDIMLLISNSGKTRELLELVRTDTRSGARHEIYRYHQQFGKFAGKRCRRMPAYGSSERSVSAGTHSDHFNDGDDRYRGYFGGRYDEKDQFQQ